MSDPPGTERPYRIDEAWSRAVHARRTGAVAAFLAPHLRGGMRLIDCGCGPGSITVDLAQAVAPGRAIGVDLREDALIHGRKLAQERGSRALRFTQQVSIGCPTLTAHSTRHLRARSSNTWPLHSRRSRRFDGC
jgi:SAM-dependent methyltransferase